MTRLFDEFDATGDEVPKDFRWEGTSSAAGDPQAVPCPNCQLIVRRSWDHLDPRTAAYQCEGTE